MAIDILALWDFSNPALSESRFEAAREGASAEDDAILLTQIVRSYGMRKEFDRARGILEQVQPLLALSSEVAARYYLELGRTHCSPAHGEEQLSASARTTGEQCYTQAFDLASNAGLHYLAVDALHMLAMTDPDPEAQLNWNRRALAYVEECQDGEARKWEGSLRNNLGYALHIAGDYSEAIVEFQKSREARLSAGNASGARIANWMIARSLRMKGDLAAALDIQLALEKEWEIEGQPDPFVYQELAMIYKGLNDLDASARYQARYDNAS